MKPGIPWHQTLAWTFFVRQAAAVLGVLALVLWVAYVEAERGARATASGTLSAGSYVLERTFEQQGKALDAGLEVFTQYSGNLALVEHALEAAAPTSVTDALIENLPRLGAELALVARPDGSVMAASMAGHPESLPEAGILQMALAPEEAKAAGHPGPFYRGFLRVSWGGRPGVYHGVARPLISPAGRPLGAMLVATRVDRRVAEDLRRVAIAGPQKGDPSAHLALLSRFQTLGSTLQDTPGLDRLLARDPALIAARAQLLDGQRSPVIALRIDGRTHLGMLSPLRGVNALDLEMADVLMLPMDPLLAPFRNLQRALLLVGALGLLAALALSLRSARKVTAPLKALAEAAEAMARGERPADPAQVSAIGEVGVLTRAFRAMLGELRAKDELLAILESASPPLKGALPGAAAGPGVAGPRPDVEATRWLAPRPPAEEPLNPELAPGSVFAGRYQIQEVLGRGGMGVVLKVRDLQLDEEVALKVVRAGLASNPAYLELLKQEIRMARRITHRYVLRTHDFGEADGIPFVTMEFLKGTTLRSLLDSRGRLPLPLVLRVVRQVAEGLEAAHAVGVVHRDIKPANVLFDTRGDAKIMDFGLAAPAATGLHSGSEALLGSPRYMAPEQILGQAVDGRTDLYALGVMLFELCTGSAPFEAPRIQDLLALHLEGPVPDVRALEPEAPADLAALISRLLSKAPGDRPQSAAEVVEILKLLASTGGGQSRI